MYWYIKCWKQYLDFSGRARRKEYWMFTLFNVIIAIITSLIDSMLGLGGILYGLFVIATLLPGLAVCVRRLHDVGKSGWWYLIALIPLIGGIVLLVWFCTEGEWEDNKWGPNPKGNEL